MKTISDIPNSFKIANTAINVNISKIDSKNRYGYWNDTTNTIHIFKVVEIDGEEIKLKDEQILNTFYHELIHCFQFYYNNEYSESEAQVFANFLREYESTKE